MSRLSVLAALALLALTAACSELGVSGPRAAAPEAAVPSLPSAGLTRARGSSGMRRGGSRKKTRISSHTSATAVNGTPGGEAGSTG